jgi:SAM-dependent methyltransferase
MIQSLLARLGEPRGGLRAAYALSRFLDVCRAEGASGLCLDVGCGVGRHMDAMGEAGVFSGLHGLDLRPTGPAVGESAYFSGPLEDQSFDATYDAIWCSHVLEHTQTPGPFLNALRTALRPGGVLCIVVPPLRHHVTVGHVNLFNGGTLMLNLLKAGFDCSQIRLRRKGYNIAAIVTRRDCPEREDFGTDPVTSYRPFLPEGLTWRQQRRTGVWRFDGDITRLNWD